MACSRTHRENHPPPSASPSSTPKPDQAHAAQESAEKGGGDPFGGLADSEELQQLFKKYPTLPHVLLEVYEATLPPEEDDDEGTTQGDLPWKLPDRNAKQNKEPWTPDIGKWRGVEALQVAREDPEFGVAVQEYCELVHYMMEKQRNASAEKLLEQQNAQDVQFVERLIEDEAR